MAPWVDEIGARFGSVLDLEKINLDREAMSKAGIAHRVRTVPTQIYLTATGREVYRHEGIATAEEMTNVLLRHGLVSPRQPEQGDAPSAHPPAPTGGE